MKTLISTGLIALLFAMQIVTLHQFSHDDDIDDCQICLIAVQSQSLEYTPVDSISIPAYQPFEVSHDIQTEYAFAKAELLSFYHLSRPPPVNC